MDNNFNPKFIAKSAYLQTILGSLKLRSPSSNEMKDCEEELIIDGGDGIRLLGYLSKQPRKDAHGLILLLHGWEGSSDSTYILSTGRYLFNKGFDIFRLNLRDHGNSHHLNEGIFNSSMIEETFNTVYNISFLSNELPFYIIGYSLGGNFALRIALKQNESKIKNLKHIFAVSPVLDPFKSTIAIDREKIVGSYFHKKWIRSLKKKEKLFPQKYDFSNFTKNKSILELTDIFVPLYTQFRDSQEYFQEYTLLENSLSSISIPVTMITSEDDPIIPVQDFYNLEKNKNLNLLIQSYGGHNGFVDLFPFSCWYEKKIFDIIKESDN